MHYRVSFCAELALISVRSDHVVCASSFTGGQQRERMWVNEAKSDVDGGRNNAESFRGVPTFSPRDYCWKHCVGLEEKAVIPFHVPTHRFGRILVPLVIHHSYLT